MKQLLSLNRGIELLQFEELSLPENICCPRCQSQNLTKDGKNKEDNRQRYKCKECGRAFIKKLPLQEKQRKIKRDIACPRCNSHYLYTAGRKQERQKYVCTNCRKSFIENPQTTVVYEKYICPICKGNETVKVGKDNSGEKQRFFCQKCQRQFTEKSAFVQLGRSIPQWNTPEEMFDYDIWDVRVLGLKPTVSSKRTVINFSTIQIEWLKQAAKDWIKHKAATDETSTLVHRVTSIKKFNDFFVKNCLNTSPGEINRKVIVDYLIYLNIQNLKPTTRGQHIGNLKDLVESCGRYGWVDITRAPLIFPEDYPKKEKRLPRFIPDEVLKQLSDNLNVLSKPVECMVLTLRETGMRISELCTLKLNCVREDSTGGYWLDIYQPKMKKEIPPIPIPRYLAETIYEQQEYIIQNLGRHFLYLFCDTKNKSSFYLDEEERLTRKVREKPLSYFEPLAVKLDPQTLRGCLHRLAKERQIRDTLGNIFPLGKCHRFRHTHGTELINQGVPQHIVQKRLGHACSEMTSVYAHVHDHTMKQEMEQFWDGRVVNNQGEVVVSENPDLDTTEMQWIKRNMKAQALADGACGIPATKNCPVQGSPCLSCSHFRTTNEFLDVHKKRLEETEKLIENARANGWDRQVETNLPIAKNLKKIIRGLEQKEVIYGDESFSEQEVGEQSA